LDNAVFQEIVLKIIDMEYGLNGPKTKPDFYIGTCCKQRANQEENQINHILPGTKGIE
jgi:hypothetical protein